MSNLPSRKNSASDGSKSKQDGLLTCPTKPGSLKREIMNRLLKNKTSNADPSSTSSSATRPGKNAPAFPADPKPGPKLPAQITSIKGSHTVEIFFGDFTSFHSVYKSICDNGVATPYNYTGDGSTDGTLPTTTVTPESIRKLVLVGHPLTSFEGISKFVRVAEACITNCKIKEAKWCDFNGLLHLHKLYIYSCGLEKIEPFQFQNLKILWVSGNKILSLSFLGQGIPTLQELNAALNEITCLHEEQLTKCTNLHTLNLSGNPLCTVQDVQALKALPNLKTLYLGDPMYGKCPVAALCDSRTMLLSFLTTIKDLDGKSITNSEVSVIQNYVFTRSLFYFANSIKTVSEQVARRKSTISSTHVILEKIGYRILQLVGLDSRYKRSLANVEILPLFTNAKTQMKDHVTKIQARINGLKQMSQSNLKRLEVVMALSRWEQETEKWLKWIEFQTYGNVQCCLIHSVHGPANGCDNGTMFGVVHHLLSALSCPGLWPQTIYVKVESAISIRDRGMDSGIQRTYENKFQTSTDPPYVPPPIDYQAEKPISNKNAFPYYTFPAYQSHRNIPTYTLPDYQSPPPIHPYPDSIPGLPEKAQPIYMFLICPQHSSTNPLVQLHRVMTEKSRHYKEIRVTNCLWLANPLRGQKFSVVIVVKVLPECLQAVSFDKSGHNHAWDCCCFSLKEPHSIAPAYILSLSFTPEDRRLAKLKIPYSDDDLINGSQTALANLASKISVTTSVSSGVYTPAAYSSKKSPYLAKSGTGLHADLSTIHVPYSLDGLPTQEGDPLHAESFMSTNGFETNFTKFLGPNIEPFLTSLNLAGNKIGLVVALRNLSALKNLNLSHNNLTTLAGLERLPFLIELKVGWNSLRFLLSNASVLATATPRLLTLEVLPNPFQDIRNLLHVPLVLRRFLPMINRIDLWTKPFSTKSPMNLLSPPLIAEAGFSHIAMARSWVGTAHSYNELASQGLTDLSLLMPKSPPFPEGFGSNGMDLDLSDNYLTPKDLVVSPLIMSLEWRMCIIKLQLQENLINSLDWMKAHVFPNIQILNLSNNLLRDIAFLAETCPNIRHLQLCGNPLPNDMAVLEPLKRLEHLKTLDCSCCPVASHPDYTSYVLTNVPSVQILDSIPTPEWELNNAIDRTGGILTQEWLETKLRVFNSNSVNNMRNITLSNCSLQKIALPTNLLPRLTAINLQHNGLSTLTNLSSMSNLRVLALGHNNINNLGASLCPTCYSHTAQSQAANSQKLRHAKILEIKNQKAFAGTVKLANSARAGLTSPRNQVSPLPAVPLPAGPLQSPRKTTPVISKGIFPKLEILVLSHNGLAGLSDLHIHSMPLLHTVMLCCNNLSTLRGLENIPTLKVLVLDNNHIREVPQNCLVGCKSLRYLHLENNRLASLPRLPHLTNLAGLFLAYNKIQSLTEVDCLGRECEVTECSLRGNLFSTRSDYRVNTAARVPHLSVLDGKDLVPERTKLYEINKMMRKDKEGSQSQKVNPSTLRSSSAGYDGARPSTSEREPTTSVRKR